MRLAVRGLAGIAAALALVLAMSASAAAQGMYYKEIRKDDRIYVFNNADEAARCEKSGELGRALTRPGSGPNGETVVGDSERALELFFFKYGISEPVTQPAQPVQKIEWRDGKTRITTDNAYLEISNRVQPRFTMEMPNDQIKLPGTGNAGDSKGSFRIRRAKTKFEGWFYSQKLSYEFQMNWPDASAANPALMVEDANIAWDFTGKGKFRIVFGQFKAPYGRQEITSSGNQAFVDRSNVSNFYGPARQTGFAVQGVLADNKLEYRAGLFNGNGRSQSLNDNDKFLWTARLMWQPNGNQALVQRAWVSGALYSEADFESTTVPLYAVAVNFLSNDFRNVATPTNTNFNVTQIGLDGIYKFKGFCGIAEWNYREQKRQSPLAGAASKFKAPGWYAQAGQMLNHRRTWEAAFRYGTRDQNDTVSGDDISEVRGGINYYYKRHGLKFQADYGQLETKIPGKASTKARELRAQAQFIF
jgi:phosphate-selective porin OprO and OprP